MLAWFPEFFEEFARARKLVMLSDGPLPLSWRNFIAIMAASRLKCEYLIRLQEAEFLSNGGDSKWLEEGLRGSSVPSKLKNIVEINAILAHRPWMINRQHIAALVKGEDSWSLSELVHAIAILITFHSLSGVVFGHGVNNEIDLENSEHLDKDVSENEIGKNRHNRHFFFFFVNSSKRIYEHQV